MIETPIKPISTLASVRHAAVAIAAVDDNQRHTGIFHLDPDSKQVLLLDLAFHNRLRNESRDFTTYIWIDPTIPIERLGQVAAMCRKVWRSNGRETPFGFSP